MSYILDNMNSKEQIWIKTSCQEHNMITYYFAAHCI